MPTVAEISKMAFDGVAGAVDGVVFTATLKYETQGQYDATTRTYLKFPTTLTGRATIGTAKAMKVSFPAFQSGPDDTLMLLEGFTQVPQEGWTVTADGVTRTIKQIGDVAGAGEFFEVVAA